MNPTEQVSLGARLPFAGLLTPTLTVAALVLAAFLAAASPAAAAQRTYDSQITGSNSPTAIAIDSADHVWISENPPPSTHPQLSEYDAYPSQTPILRLPGYGGNPARMAVDDSEGLLYIGNTVLDASTGAFSSSWQPLPDFFGLAVDNSGNASNEKVFIAEGGGVYAFDPNHNAVDFKASAPYISANQLTGTPAGPFDFGYAHNTAFTYGEGSILATDPEGDIYVAESGRHRVDEFAPSGEFIREFGAAVPAPFTPYALAVDPTDGNLLVVNPQIHDFKSTTEPERNSGVIDEFSPSGEFIEQISEANGAPFGSLRSGIAVNSAGYLYLAEGGAVDIFTPKGNPPKLAYQTPTDQTPTSATLRATVDPAGGGEITDCYFEYGTETAGGSPHIPCQPATPYSGPTEVSAPVSGLTLGTTYYYHVVLTNAAATRKGPSVRLGPPSIHRETATDISGVAAGIEAQVNPSGFDTAYEVEYGTSEAYGSHTAPLDLGSATEAQPASIALHGLSPETTYHYRVLATNSQGAVESSEDHTFKTEPPLRIEAAPATSIGRSCATLEAKVNPEGSPTEVFFEYGTEAGLYGSQTTPAPIGEGAGFQSVAKQVCGLSYGPAYGVTYHFRARATNPAAPAGLASPDRAFTTLPTAAISGISASPLGDQAATLSAKVNPLGLDTEYRFEYLTEAQYQANGETFTGATRAPEPDADLGAGSEPALASQLIHGLTPETTYRYRLFAHNSSGTVEGSARSFTTPGPEPPPNCPTATEASPGFRPYLPDCRAYELVNPPFLDGYSPGGGPISTDGNRYLFSSFGSFAGTEANPDGVSQAAYEIQRTAAGWRTRAVTPPASALSWSSLEDASPDLSRTVWIGHTPTQSAEAADLYLRQADGSLVLVGPTMPASALHAPPSSNISYRVTNNIVYAGASRNLAHLFFTLTPGSNSATEDDVAWPGDLTLPGLGPNGSSLYELSGTADPEPGLVAVRNHGPLHSDSEAQLISQCGAGLGAPRRQETYNAVSASGNTVFFTPNPGGCTGGGGAGPPAFELYARLGSEETFDLSEPSAADCSACQTASPQKATFQGASADGSRAFFLTEQELLPETPGQNLYEYDFDAPAGQRVTAVSHLTSAEPAQVLGVSRVSEDGSHVYFVAKSVLTEAVNTLGSEAQQGQPNLYAYDTASRHTTFVASLAPGACSGNNCTGDAVDWAVADERPVQATPDGRYLLFQSKAQLTPDDTSTVAQLFEYDAQTGELARVSVGHRDPGGYPCAATGHTEAGFACDGNTEDPDFAPTIGVPIFTGAAKAMGEDGGLSLSSDGSTILFSSNAPLVPGANEVCRHTYEYRSHPGAIAQGNVSLLSDPQQVASVFISGCGSLAAMDPSARDILVSSSNPLVPQATNSASNIYDAREDGGFPAPERPVGCEAEHCQRLSPAPAESPNATEGFTAPPNPLYCRKGFVAKGGKCVRKHSKPHKRHKRRAHAGHRRAGRRHGGAK